MNGIRKKLQTGRIRKSVNDVTGKLLNGIKKKLQTGRIRKETDSV